MEERLTVNQDVEGSNPSVAVFILIFDILYLLFVEFNLPFGIRDRRKFL